MLNQIRQVFEGTIEVSSDIQLCDNDHEVNNDSRTAEFFLTVESEYDEEVHVPFNEHRCSLYQLMKGVAPRLYSGNSRTVAIDAILNVTNKGHFKPE